MNILIFGANWNNHGDESAIRAMIDEMRISIPDAKIKIQFNQDVNVFPYNDIEIIKGFYRAGKRNPITKLLYRIAVKSGGKLCFYKGKERLVEFTEAVKWADYAIYAPGGPSIGDYYQCYYLVDMMEVMYKNETPFSLFAPSIGPFSINRYQIANILKRANLIIFREEISKKYFDLLKTGHDSVVTLDAAFQSSVDQGYYQKLLEQDTELVKFLGKYKKIIGITITDLLWHRTFKDGAIADRVKDCFTKFITYLKKEGYGVVFIPQLFANENDSKYMRDFCQDNCFVINQDYDCYFQQYLISKLYAVVGMRYHSNIFSAKMGTPFVSVAYEQKMKGFMEKAGLSDLCIDISELSYEALIDKMNWINSNYSSYKTSLNESKNKFKVMAHVTTELISNDIVNHIKKVL